MSPIIESLPILILYPHGRCNCRCLMCDIWKDAAARQMSAAELEGYLGDLESLRVQRVVFSGGEPLMHPDLFRFCELLRERGTRTTLLSTGLLFERHAARIVESTDDAIVSLDGPPAIHDRIRRVHGAFEHLARGIQAVLALRPDLPVSARCTVQRENCANLCETARAARQLHLTSISFLAADVASEAFNRAEPWSLGRRSQIALSEAEIAILEGEIDGLTAEWAGTGFVVESREKLLRISHHFRACLGLREPVAPCCNAPWVSAVVEADGTVRPCFFHRPIGRLDGNGLLAVLNGPAAVAFRAGLDVNTNSVCRQCVCSLHWR